MSIDGGRDGRPLRVLYLIPDLGKGGAERFLIDIATAMQERDDVVIEIGCLQDSNLYGNLADELPITTLNFRTFTLRGPNSCPEYSALLKRFRPDVIHTHLFLAEFLTSYEVDTGVAYICHGHDNMRQFRRPSWRALVDREVTTNLLEKRYLIQRKYKRVRTAFVANSAHTRDYYQRVLPRYMEEDVVLIPYGFNYSRFFRRRQPTSLPDRRLRLINVGSFQPKKNQILIVDIARELLRRQVDFEIDLLGDGSERAGVEAAVESAGLSERVRLHGNVQDVERWMGESDIYLHTAWYEPFGLVFLEAMAAGIPCVTLDGLGNRDLIEDGRNGFLIEQPDPRAFADRIVALMGAQEKYGEMSAYAQNFALKYDIEPAAERLVTFYRSRLELMGAKRT